MWLSTLQAIAIVNWIVAGIAGYPASKIAG
jgi:hypothetical protein